MPRNSAPAAKIVPLPSIRKALGIELTLYIFETLPSLSQPWYFQSKPSFSMACFQAASSRSKEMLMISKPFPFLNFALLYLEYACTTLGFSRRQGPHQEAQKSISTNLPLNLESEMTFPSFPTNLKAEPSRLLQEKVPCSRSEER